MTQEDKELLLKDLCARMPYGVIGTDNRHGDSIVTPRVINLSSKKILVYYWDFDEYGDIEECKLYLRPMSSMTKEERAERIAILWELEGHIDEDVTYKYQDWLLSHHFDFRNLIGKGLALEAPEGMYKEK